jgi:molecular chaperone DnaJ
MSTKEDDNPYYKGLDAYQILECPRTADKKEIKAAYRKLVAKWHPDKFPDDEVKKKEGGLRMEKINRAYFCLEDDGITFCLY